MAAVEGILVVVVVVVIVVVSAKRKTTRYQIMFRTDLLPAHVCAILCGSKTVPLPREKPRPLRLGWALAGGLR